MKRVPGACAAALAATIALAACGATSASPTIDPGAVTTVLPSTPVPAGDWQRFDYDAQRSGVGPTDTGITARNLGSLRVRRVHLDGTVDSSPIELHAISVRGHVRDVVVVTTTYGRTIALDPRTGAKLWEYTPPDIRGYDGTAQVTTTTPIADPDRRYVYAASPDGVIRKLVLATGREVRSAHWPASVTFDATHEKLASALNISGSDVVATTGGYIGDAPPYQGHVAVIDRASGRIVHIWNSLCSMRHRLIVPSSCSSSDSAIWARAGAVIEPGSGRILVATGNGPFNGSNDWGDSVLELSRGAGALLQNWTPTDQYALNVNDTDLGSSAPALLPIVNGVPLAVQTGKDALVHLLRLDRLNGTGGAGPRTGGQLQDIGSPGGAEVFTQPAVWTHAGRTYVFVADSSGTTGYVLAGGGRPRLRVAWQQAASGTSPIVAGGLLYVYNADNGGVSVRDPTSGIERDNLPAATGHWNSPIVVSGRIVVPEGNYMDHADSGTIDIYHLPGR